MFVSEWDLDKLNEAMDIITEHSADLPPDEEERYRKAWGGLYVLALRVQEETKTALAGQASAAG